MALDIKQVLDTEFGSIAISVLLGIGLAALFRTACKDGKCVVITGPPRSETENYYYKIDDNCFKYTPVSTECTQ
jgi:hypothetical protein